MPLPTRLFIHLLAIAAAASASSPLSFTAEQQTLRARNAAAGVPLPTQAQLGAMRHSFVAFNHFSMCTFTGCQWNTAVSPATDYAPPDAGPDFDQMMRVVTAAGATQMCLTVRHVGGFAQWQTSTTNYSVAASNWKSGKGDAVADFVAAARRNGISPCFYIILGFNVEANHTGVQGPLYLERQVEALTELLTNYGHIDRLWWDNYAIGCCQPVTHEYLFCPGGGVTSTPSAACPGWQVLIDTVRALSPLTAVVPGPDGCLVDAESFGGTYPLYHASTLPQHSYSCTDATSMPGAGSTSFGVVESDFTVLEPGDNWFWEPSAPWLNASAIWDQVNAKLEQGANLILNIPANSSGVIPEAIEEQLAAFGAARAATYADPRGALAAPVAAACAALSVIVAVNASFDTLLIVEDLTAGQVIAAYTVEARDAASGAWRALTAGVHGKTVGLRLVDFVGLQTGVDALRFNCSADLAPAPPQPPASFVNAAGKCMGMPDGETFPCYVGNATPGGEVFHLCELVAADCGGAAAVWSEGSTAGTLFALGAAPDATINIDCNACAPGTHLKIIADADCGCASAMTYNASLQQFAVDACPGMCVTNGEAPGALPSCAGDEPVAPTQLHLAPCGDASTRGAWTRVLAHGVAPVAPVATLAQFGAYLTRRP